MNKEQLALLIAILESIMSDAFIFTDEGRKCRYCTCVEEHFYGVSYGVKHAPTCVIVLLDTLKKSTKERES